MKLTKYNQLTHNMKVTCTINGIKIDDAKLSIDRRTGKVFICQDYKRGYNTENKLGYKFSWFLAGRNENIDKWDKNIKNLESVEKVNTGFDPENLTFNGVKIKEGDRIGILNAEGKYEVKFNKGLPGHLGIDIMENNSTRKSRNDKYNLTLGSLNITAHHPKKDKELERLEGEVEKAIKELIYGVNNAHRGGISIQALFDRYYQARKELEKYKSNNQ
jgi:hypothetical protein